MSGCVLEFISVFLRVCWILGVCVCFGIYWCVSACVLELVGVWVRVFWSLCVSVCVLEL